MLKTTLLLAQVVTDTPEELAVRDAVKKNPWGIFGGETGMILGAILLVAAIVFLWAFFLRKRPQYAHGALIVERESKPGKGAGSGSSGKQKRRKRRPDHPDNWGRNPTLGETGGLPEPRVEESAASSAQETDLPRR